MSINYPGGTNANPFYPSPNHKPQIDNYADRGMTLEADLNQSNRYYLEREIAVIHKKPTPIQIVKVDYHKRSAAVIKEAYFNRASTTDYNGIYKGRYIDFDAKETKSQTAFPLSNFHEHQIEHLRKCVKLGGICFALIKFVRTNEIFLFKATDLFQFWDAQHNGGRKSIPKLTIQELGYNIKYRLQPLIPYLDAVDQIMD
ncbi:Holliday junction resolvase RecU [Nicoliella spurrieriana]|uniref:Holliday junction resolvase RecU n=1 Tax=Nicoliella spurrieriana TaxID=2925830 RepID=A0A976X5F4_9LACO|nr:Holliday junction resolvase RecU [Nicoliella spurrieriana]UQS86609.1 Holliday junction resolvase RecU [Nicoliella spurrieriana]